MFFPKLRRGFASLGAVCLLPFAFYFMVLTIVMFFSVIPTHFQHTFMKLLRNAQFEELSAEDLLLTDALNTDYLLTLPIYVDWKKASESSAIIFR